MRFYRFLLALVTVIALGCSSETRNSETSGVDADAALVSVQTFDGRGLVTSVMPNRSHIVVDHEDMPGFMSAMKMPFAIKDSSVATGVSAGDSIQFTVEVDGPYTHIIRLEILGR